MTSRCPRIVYVANARIPGSRAHSIQIVRSCEALMRAGAQLEAWIPKRVGTGTLAPTAETLIDYYGLDQAFPVRRLYSLDAIDLVPLALQHPAFLIQSATFAAAVRRRLPSGNDAWLYVRDPYTLAFLVKWRSALGSRIVYEAHGVPRGKLSLTRLRWALRDVSRLIVLNDILAERYLELGIDPGDLLVIPADAVGEGDLPEKQAARKTLELGPRERVVCYSGSLSREKGVQTLIQAAGSLLSSTASDDWRVILVGGDSRQSAWALDLARGNHRVRIDRAVAPSQVEHYLAAADILVLPNSAEQASSALWTSPMKLFEYYRAQRPIVCSDVPALRMAVVELLRATGDGDVTSKVEKRSPISWAAPDDPRALAASIEQAWKLRGEIEFTALPLGARARRARRILDHLDSSPPRRDS